jgi:hypothetical protein
MSTVGGGGNYISDGSIMAWLATQQDRIYGDLRDSMDLSEKRADFTDALNDIKAELETANKSQDHDFSKADQDLQAFMEKYGSDPDFSATCGELQTMANQIHTDCQSRQDYGQQVEKFKTDMTNYNLALGKVATGNGSQADFDLLAKGVPHVPVNPGPQSYSDDQMKTWDTLISGKTDVASKNDQLTMIHIQELKATLDQGAQLGSTFISSGDKTSSAIINNIA